MPALQEHYRKRVTYYYDSNVGNYYYGPNHVMKPHRIRMTHHLVQNYGIYRHLDVYRPYPATFDEMTRFHSEDYMDFLKNVTPKNRKQFNKEILKKFGVEDGVEKTKDCPVFDGLFEFCQLTSGGSIGLHTRYFQKYVCKFIIKAAAVKLNQQKADIAINWMGGLHHAKESKASGFCYTNDIVLAILELWKRHKRVLYVDIDVHHGDGVEEAFYDTDRVMTVSFHKYDGIFFPRTGELKSIGAGKGRNYSVNVPLKDGMTDQAFEHIYSPIMKKVMEVFQPNAIVLQCGADSLNEDRLGNLLGSFNLTLRGHGKCVEFLRDYNVPLMLLGGGGYTPENVARCWTYETSLAVNVDIPDELPFNEYFKYFAPNYRLHIDPSCTKTNENTPDYLQAVMYKVLENLSKLPAVPSVQFMPIPPDAMQIDERLDIDESDPDKRLPRAIRDHMVAHPGEFYDGEEEGDDRKNRQQKSIMKGRQYDEDGRLVEERTMEEGTSEVFEWSRLN